MAKYIITLKTYAASAITGDDLYTLEYFDAIVVDEIETANDSIIQFKRGELGGFVPTSNVLAVVPVKDKTELQPESENK